MKNAPAVCCASLALSLLGSVVHAQGTNFRLRQIATAPGPLTVLASAPGDPSRLFMGQSSGVIWIVNLPSGTVNATPFLTLPGSSYSNGLLNLVFDPRWAQNGYFYASAQQSPGGTVNVYRGRVSATDPNVADPASVVKVFSHAVASGQHTGGLLSFGDDGYLYLTSGDQSGNPQDLSQWGGKIFRIDVDGPDNIPGNADDDAFPADANNNYSIPPGNPYIGVANALPEIWASGLRNPYRVTKDPATGTFWIADVGGGYVEEVDLMPAGQAGMNFGWPILEGTRCNSTAANCAAMISTPPIMEYPHLGPALLTGNAIIGGVVYHGRSMPWLEGTYFFSDNAGRWIATMRDKNGQRQALTNRQFQMNPAGQSSFSCFAADANGEVYVCTYSGGKVYVIEPTVLRDCNHNGLDDGFEGLPTCPADFDGNCGVEIDDLVAYLIAYERGDLSADYDDGSGEGLVDGAVTVDDLLMYLNHFEAGC